MQRCRYPGLYLWRGRFFGWRLSFQSCCFVVLLGMGWGAFGHGEGGKKAVSKRESVLSGPASRPTSAPVSAPLSRVSSQEAKKTARGCRDGVARIGEVCISASLFRMMYALRRKKEPGIQKKDLLQQVVETILIALKARSLGFALPPVSESSVTLVLSLVLGVPQDALRRYLSMTWGVRLSEYVMWARYESLKVKVVSLVEAAISVSERELRAQYRKIHTEVLPTCLQFTTQKLRLSSPSVSQVQAFVRGHKEVLRKRYREKRWRFIRPRRKLVHFAGVLVRSGATKEQKSKAKQALRELRRRVAGAPASFLRQAMQWKKGSERYRLGSILSPPGRLMKPLQQMLRRLKQPGQQSPVVKVAPGFFFLQLTEVKPAQAIPFSQASVLMAKEELQRRSLRDFFATNLDRIRVLWRRYSGRTLMRKWKQAAKSDHGLRELLRVAKGPPKDLFSMTEEWAWVDQGSWMSTHGMGKKGPYAQVFQLTRRHPFTRVIEIGALFMMCKLKRKKEADMKGYPAMRKRLREDLLRHKFVMKMKAWIRQLRKSTKVKVFRRRL